MQSQVKRRIVFGLTTGGLLAAGGAGIAHADATSAGSGDGATTSGSPGVLSGNTIQVPINIPINVCGITANVVGLLNPAAGDHCSNSGGATAAGADQGGTGGATAVGGSQGSPGVLSGNTIQAPISIPVNACGDSVNVVGVGNGATGDHCHNGSGATTGGTGGATAVGGSQGSPGVLSGNTIQVPVNIPVNLCGDTVNVVGVGNGAKGDHCHNAGGASTGGTGGATAVGGSQGSPGVLSGNTIQLPISVPVNLCGDSVNVVGVGNGAKGDACANNTPVTPPPTSPPPPVSGVLPPLASTPETGSALPEVAPAGMLAHTGSDALMLAPIGAALMGGGAFMYRRYKPTRVF
ncbi:chaplin [Catenulispora pinistramenti]|uniref:chaplin n=1 Tax=Catenulispora pinistramenti TaxID=2705254 RepID=UPI001E5F836F